MEHKDKITDLESEVTDLKDLVDQHRDTFNSKFVSTVKPELYSFNTGFTIFNSKGFDALSLIAIFHDFFSFSELNGIQFGVSDLQ